MPKLLLSMFIEAFIAISLAGVILGLAIPALSLVDAAGKPDLTATLVIVGVLVGAVATAFFRPGSAIRRYFDRSE
jgi:H+/Cl- antiporter ClcA